MRISALLLTVLLAAYIQAENLLAKEAVTLPPKEKFHLYLLMGQSNMAGRGRMTDADRRPVPRVLMLTKENQWAPAKHPLHFGNLFFGDLSFF